MVRTGTASLALRWVLLVATTCFVHSAPTWACELVAPDRSPLELRKPVRGRDVFFGAGFGLRRHPILGIERLHTGVDWKAPTGAPVMAAGRGRVIAAGRDGQYGNRVIVDHGGSWQTLYAHMLAFIVREGDCVEAGAMIGRVGTTGLSERPHLHFEVLRDGRPVDPMILPLGAAGGQKAKRDDH